MIKTSHQLAQLMIQTQSATLMKNKSFKLTSSKIRTSIKNLIKRVTRKTKKKRRIRSTRKRRSSNWLEAVKILVMSQDHVQITISQKTTTKMMKLLATKDVITRESNLLMMTAVMMIKVKRNRKLNEL